MNVQQCDSGPVVEGIISLVVLHRAGHFAGNGGHDAKVDQLHCVVNNLTRSRECTNF